MNFYLDKPLWEGNEIRFEPIGFRYDKEGALHVGQLLYEPEEILAVTAWDWQTPLREGVDYTRQGRCFGLPEGSGLPVYPYDRNLVPYAPGEEPNYFETWFDNSRHVSIDEKAYEFQIAVSYTHQGKWAGKIPQNQRDRLPAFFEKLEKGQEVNVVYFGDSIAAGCEASGMDEQVIFAMHTDQPGVFRQKEFHMHIDREPHLPSWPRMMSDALQQAYPKAKVNHINRSAPGHSTEWALWACKDTVNPLKPDLCVIAFGMNQAGESADSFAADTKKLIEMISAENPGCEFILMSTHEPNRDAAVYQHHVLMEQEEKLLQLQSTMTQHIAVAPVHSTFRTLYHMGKTFGDLTGNNINHPNDFSIRLYAQILFAVLGL